MSFIVAGIGTALPEHSLTQADAVELHTTFCRIDEKRARTLKALYRRSGITTRRSVLLDTSDGPLPTRQSFYHPARCEDDGGPATAVRMEAYEELAPGLAIDAARNALGAAATDPGEVSHLITVSCTGFVSPGVDAAMIDGLGLRRTTERTHVGFMGCHGSLNALRVARSYVEADPSAVTLVCSVELCTLHFAYRWDPDMLVANALFGDGAAALVGRARRDGDEDAWRVAGSGTLLMADSENDMTWRIGDHGFRMTLSARVPDLIGANLREWLVEWLRRHDLVLADVATWAIHPGGPRILSATEQALGLSREGSHASRSVLAECGNMSSATILFILDRLRAEGAPRPCVALAYGPGLVVEAVLFA